MTVSNAEKVIKKSRLLRAAAVVLPFLYMSIMFWFSAQPGSNISLPAPDYIMHGIEYAGLAVLLRFALQVGGQVPARRAAWLAIVLSVLYGLSDEWHQSFTPGRDPSMHDILADGVGATLAQGALFLVAKVQQRYHTDRT